MSTASHTPGPWSLRLVNKPQATAFDTYAEGSDCSSLSGTIVAGSQVVARVPIEGTAGFSKLIHYRDAQLIATAPELLEALRRTTEMCEAYADWIKRNVMSADIEQHPYLPELEGVAEDARAAISKATGAAA